MNSYTPSSFTRFETLNDALRWRYAAKKFDCEWNVPQNILDEILDSASLTPTSFGLQPIKIDVHRNRNNREKLEAAAGGQAQVSTCSDLIIISANVDLGIAEIDEYVGALATKRDTTREALAGLHGAISGVLQARPKEAIINWCMRQSYIVAGMIIASASLHGVDNCPMEGFDGTSLAKALGEDPNKFMPTVIIALGKRAADDKMQHAAKYRKPRPQFVTEHN